MPAYAKYDVYILQLLFLAVQDSSIGDLVSPSVRESVTTMTSMTAVTTMITMTTMTFWPMEFCSQAKMSPGLAL